MDEFMKQITELTGVPPLVFLVVSTVVAFLMVAVRKAMKKYEGADWFSLALDGISLAVSGLLAFFAWKADFYSCSNVFVVIWVGLGNWLIASKGWQLAKQGPRIIKVVKALTSKSEKVEKEEKNDED